jgi:hypothetical protein
VILDEPVDAIHAVAQRFIDRVIETPLDREPHPYAENEEPNAERHRVPQREACA